MMSDILNPLSAIHMPWRKAQPLLPSSYWCLSDALTTEKVQHHWVLEKFLVLESLHVKAIARISDNNILVITFLSGPVHGPTILA